MFDPATALREAANNFFPFTLRASETPHYTYSPHAFRKTFLEVKPEGLTWYAYDVIIYSPTKITFVVYDMRDTSYGGIGKEITRIDAKVSVEITAQACNERMFALARDVRQQELDASELQMIGSYADQLREMTKEPQAA